MTPGVEVLTAIAEAVISHARKTRRITAIGPFFAMIDPRPDMPWLSSAVLSPSSDRRHEVDEALPRLTRHFQEQGRSPHLEYIESIWPDLAWHLERAGYRRGGRHPLLVRTERVLVPTKEAGISVIPVKDDSDAGLLADFIRVQRGAFDEAKPLREADIDGLRRDLALGALRCCIALRDGIPAGAGALQPAARIAEVVGVGTLPAHRGRGVGALVTAFLANAHLEEQGDGGLVWLSAGSEAALRLYSRLGFAVTGAFQLDYDCTPPVPSPSFALI